ncbi:hypothetical protein HQ489_02155 [Candidatus Woesearchaeota archaeon]|nr:hypothetical protein [Candidatus Woesearchaeota archaeon]
MVSKKDKLKVTQYVCDGLEESNNYDILNKDEKSVYARVKTGLTDKPYDLEVVIANFLGPAKNYSPHHLNNYNQGIHTCPILYKDDKSAFVRLVENQAGRFDKSLKRYSPHQIHQMLALRAIEKEVTNKTGNQRVIYFQPETDHLDEGLRVFALNKVNLDYSHIPHFDRRYDFVENRTSIDYKLPQDQGRIETPLDFGSTDKHYRTVTLIHKD